MSEGNGHPPGPNEPAGTDDTKVLQSFAGPTAHGKETTVTLLTRAQLIASGLIPQLENLINASFNSQRNHGILEGRPRLRYEGQFLDQLGHAPDTFIYVVRTVDAGDVIATAYASRYEGVAEWPEGPGERTWERLGVVGDESRAWELHMMAVSSEYQRQGLAEYLMRLVDAEVVRREVGAGNGGKRLVLFISTIKQTNEAFYVKKGFREAYAVDWPDGHLGSPRGWTVVHMDREIKV